MEKKNGLWRVSIIGIEIWIYVAFIMLESDTVSSCVTFMSLSIHTCNVTCHSLKYVPFLFSRVNCSFYFKIGACRHGDRCSRLHNKPTFSQVCLHLKLYFFGISFHLCRIVFVMFKMKQYFICFQCRMLVWKKYIFELTCYIYFTLNM